MTLPCPTCAVHYEAISARDAHDVVVEFVAGYHEVLAPVLEDRLRLQVRPAPAVWAPIEYAAHVRDALRYHGATINRALTHDRPELPEPDPDRAAIDGHYLDEDPREVLAAIDAHARRLATRISALDHVDLTRTVRRGGQEITVLSMVRNVAHEGAHHLLDIRQQLS